MTARWSLMLVLGACSGVTLDDDPSTDLTSSCEGAQDYQRGMSALTDVTAHEVILLSATPEPPDVRDNQWVVEIRDGNDATAAGLPVRLRPWMPLHQHGTTPSHHEATDLGDGTYQIDFRLPMPGLWEFFVDVSGDDTDVAMLALCAQG